MEGVIEAVDWGVVEVQRRVISWDGGIARRSVFKARGLRDKLHMD